MACYGFAVWDVGQNRLMIKHGGLIGAGEGQDATMASHHAALEGLRWLIRQAEHRRRVVVRIDHPLAYAEIEGRQAAPSSRTRTLVAEVRQTLARFPQHALQLVPTGQNQQAMLAADQAFVEAQEADRRIRAAEVIPELRSVGSGVYRVGDRYRVDLAAGTCSCPDFRQVHSERHPIRCKHLLAAWQVANEAQGEADRGGQS
jgi:hypothetical protein